MMNIWTTEQEAENLRKRFQNLNRAAFARDHHLKGGQAIIYQHITGRRPISLDAAIVYADAFKCPLEEISPRLALEAKEATARTNSQNVSRSTQPPAPLNSELLREAITLVVEGSEKIGYKLTPQKTAILTEFWYGQLVEKGKYTPTESEFRSILRLVS